MLRLDTNVKKKNTYVKLKLSGIFKCKEKFRYPHCKQKLKMLKKIFFWYPVVFSCNLYSWQLKNFDPGQPRDPSKKSEQTLGLNLVVT